jgi:alpha-L-rhamnosidase
MLRLVDASSLHRQEFARRSAKSHRVNNVASLPKLQPIWPVLPAGEEEQQDTHVAFRGSFVLDGPGEAELRLLGVSWFNAWIDGKWIAEGPLRFTKAYPEWDAVRVSLPAGKHTLAIHAHYYGVNTGLMMNMPPFIACDASVGGSPVPMDWRCLRLSGYLEQKRRTSHVFGWAEFCDTREQPAAWQEPLFDDSDWETPAKCDPEIGEPALPLIAPVKCLPMPLAAVAEGRFSEEFGYENDDPPLRFFLRDLESEIHDPQGVWRRYDLGQTRLGRPRFVLDVPEGAVVEFGYSEVLRHGRVSPWMTLVGVSCYMDRFTARGGVQEFTPHAPKGMRYLEVHVNADPSGVKFLMEKFGERCYHGEAEGIFRCEDDLLNRVWKAGIDTYRACAEDAILDCPTRERGQWIGDLVGAGMEIASVGFDDLRLVKRALVQAVQCAREDGMVAGLCPQKPGYLSTYAAQWTGAVLHYWQLSGDRSIVESLFDAAEKNIAAFFGFMTEDGITDCDSWAFVDWGYVRNEGPADMALNLHILEAVRVMVDWCKAVGRADRATHYFELADRLAGIIRKWYDATIPEGWETVGFQRAALGIRLGLLSETEARSALAFMKKHMLRCFPNDDTAPKPFDPGMTSTRLITPYFSHYSLPPLIESGEMDFVLEQFRVCWGYALSLGITTSIEVFDTRWSQCHQWASCPTWQLSRYALGLHPRFDLGAGHFDFKLMPGSLKEASGVLPLPFGGGQVEVSWMRDGDAISYLVSGPGTFFLHADCEVLEVAGRAELRLRPEGAAWMFERA